MKRGKIPVWQAALYGAVGGALIARVLFRDHPQPPGAFLERLHIPWLAPDPAFQGHWPFVLASIACWAVFSLYWDIAAKNAAAAQRSESRRSRGLHVLLVNVALLLEILPVRGLGRYLPVSAYLMAAGLAVQAGGTFLAVWARRHLGRNWSGAIAIKVEHQLIRTGPYGRLRHPIYTGLLTMYLGMAIVMGERLALAGFALAALAYWRKIRLEEAALGAAFGVDYAAYRKTSWALVPGLF